MTHCYISGGLIWNIRSIFDVSESELYRSVWRAVDALNNEFPIGLEFIDTKILEGLEKNLQKIQDYFT